MRRSSIVLVAVLLPALAGAFQADLVPTASRPETEDFTGGVSLGGSDGTIRVTVEGVADAAGDLVDGELTVQLKLRVNGQRRRVTLPLAVEAGDGEVIGGLGLVPDDRVIVNDVRLRGRNGRTIAQAGTVTSGGSPSPPPTLPPAPDQCPAALVSCQSDLTDCEVALDECELGF